MTSPRLRFWLLSAAALAGLLSTAALGFWQLSRAAEKISLQAEIEQRQRLPVLQAQALVDALATPAALHRSVLVRGRWLAAHTVFLDNRQMKGRPGFFVVTPLQIENSELTVLVQRGWAPRSFVERTQLPALPTPAGLVELEGRIAPPPSKLYDFGGPQSGAIRQNLDVGAFSREIGVALVGVSVLQLGTSNDGLARNWLQVDTGVQKHYGYAFQWFALCGLIAILYVWFQIVRRHVRER